jgi:transposase
MHIVGLDLGKRKSQACVALEDGTIVVERRLSTTKEALASFFAPFAPARILVEASTCAEWVARHLESSGHTVIVGDPRFAPMYARLDKHIKTDKRDAQGLKEALRLQAFQRAHRRADWARDLRAQMLVRANLVRARARMVSQVRSLLDARGLVVASCPVEMFLRRLEEVAVDQSIGALVLPILAQIESLNVAIAEQDAELEQTAATHPVARKLDAVVGVGPITALAFVCAVEDPKRFKNARELASFFGFVPREYSSAEKVRRGATTKTGDTMTRTYVIQCAWGVLRSKRPEVAGLRAWAQQVGERRGRRIAVTALARKLVRIMFAMWRDDAEFDPAKLNQL